MLSVVRMESSRFALAAPDFRRLSEPGSRPREALPKRIALRSWSVYDLRVGQVMVPKLLQSVALCLDHSWHPTSIRHLHDEHDDLRCRESQPRLPS